VRARARRSPLRRWLYEYAADGGKKLWSGLSRFKLRDAQVSMADAETGCCTVRPSRHCLPGRGCAALRDRANLGSIFAIGFPAHTGGALQFIRGIGTRHFAARAAELAQRYGERFVIKESALESCVNRSRCEVLT